MHGRDTRGALVQKGRFNDPERFGRMFPHLRSLKDFKPGSRELGKATGPMDGGAALVENDDITAGFTFLGQFLDHDITFDPTSSLERQNDPAAIRNFRTPALELDSVYGAGPGAQPYLYEAEPFGAFRIETHPEDVEVLDVPRAGGRTAIIGDPRNDENRIIGQLHLAFMKFHNAVLAGLPDTMDPNTRFEEAQRLVRWHYQWIVLHEFLPLTCGPVVDDILAEGRLFFHFEGEAYIPVEFSVAAYRFGHSQVRPGYGLGAGGGTIFGEEGSDLRGNSPLTRRLVIDWRRFFGTEAQQGLKIDTKLAGPLLALPETVVPPRFRRDPAMNTIVLDPDGNKVDDAVRSLAERNLMRGLAFSLPSGQSIANYMSTAGIVPLSDAEIWDGVPGGEGPAPLWYYILKEAELCADGKRLDGVGARIVAEVFIGLLEGDLASYINQQPNWTPTLPCERPGHFAMVDLLKFAGGFEGLPVPGPNAAPGGG